MKDFEKLIENLNKKDISIENKKIYEERILKELKIIKETKTEDSFIICLDIIEWAKSQGLLVRSVRGAGQSSLIAYLLGITIVDPMKHNLIFERYINTELKMAPYFSLDVSSNKINDLMSYLEDKYGIDKILRILRDEENAPDEVYILKNPIKNTKNAISEISSNLEENILVRFDVWSSEALTIIDETVKKIRTMDKNFDIENIPLNDPKTYKLISTGDTKDVFMLEDANIIKYLKTLKPDCFEDIVAIYALSRPGSMEAGFMDLFIKRKHGLEVVEYAFKELEDIMKETYGVFIYQEQIQMIAHKIAGYTLGEADILRRLMGKSMFLKTNEQKSKFIERAKKNGFNAEKVAELFDFMIKISSYLFCRAHISACSLIGYRTTYLKANYSKEYKWIVHMTSERFLKEGF